MPRRLTPIALLLLLAGCAASPEALGLTGAAPPAPPRHPDDATVTLPGLPTPGGYGTPATGTTGTGRYFGTP
ncbi:MAG: hypothetical protein KGI51_04895 [Rhodospirillales bacterium]|nr:hypothetical protein [Rhodospirillales bacterium]